MRKKYDWDFIQSEYQETDKSIRKIAKENNISEGAIRSRIKKHKWEKPTRSEEISQMMVTKSTPIRGNAAKIMREIINILGERYNPSFEAMIVIFVSNYELWIDVREQMINSGGAISTTSKGTKQASVEFIVMKEIEKTLREYASYIGLSMAELIQIGLNKQSSKEENSISDLAKEAYERKIIF